MQDRDQAEYNVIMHKANSNTYNFSCRAKQDTYNVGIPTVIRSFSSSHFSFSHAGNDPHSIRYFAHLAVEL